MADTQTASRGVLFLLAACCALFTTVTGARTARFVSRSARVAGTVVAVGPRDGSTSPWATIRYPVGGHTLTFETPTRYGRLSVGDVMPVRFDSKRPTDARRDAIFALWLLPIIGAVGTLSLGIAAVKRDR